MILIVDDDQAVTASLALLLKQAGYACHAAASPAEALAFVDRQPCRLVLQDMNFSRRTTGEEGLDLLARLKRANPDLPVILMTAWGSIPLAVEGMKAGATDFVTKPWTNQQLLQGVRTALGLAASAQGGAADRVLTRDDLDSNYDFGELVGRDPQLLKILHLVGRVAPTDVSVLITGESGTGKELIAQAVHRNSRRRSGPLVKVNLGGIAPTLFESEMFGHVRGAFTDARQDRKGRFEVADGGTIFLDEVGELAAEAQVKLLRVLQDRTFEMLGTSQTRSVDVRVVSATNRNLAELVERGEFREDLLYRLNLISIQMPALRQRPDDVPLLASRFVRAAAEVYRRDRVTIGATALRWLRTLPWPGNVRQLRQWVERAVLVTSSDTLEIDDFRAAADMEAPPVRDALPAVGAMTMEEMERAMIEKSLRFHAGNLTKVAESLGLSRPALYRRLERYGITP